VLNHKNYSSILWAQSLYLPAAFKNKNHHKPLDPILYVV
jgi:hypothetical protein